MKKLILFLLLCTARNAFTQAGALPPGTDSAMLYLTGTFKKYNPSRAFHLFMQRANTGEAKAMNAVGLQYARGLGVDTSFSQAVYWLRQAANNGYTKAWVNLGMLYKFNSSDSTGYAVAVGYFDTALQQSEPSAFFAKGYMLYKGLGCMQSYAAALVLFREGVHLGRPDCMYFTGLCYKFGYGVPANADSAAYYINKAALRGYKQANAELAFQVGDNTAARRQRKAMVPVVTLKEADNVYAQPAFTRQFVQIEGTYTGWLTQYDYSGKWVIDQLPLTLDLKASGHQLTGVWQQGDGEPVEITAVQNGNRLDFSAATFLASTVKARQKKQKLVFKTAFFTGYDKADSFYLQGSLQLFNTHSRETEKPVNIRLVKATPSGKKPPGSLVVVYPNPVVNSFNVAFTLARPGSVKITIYTTQGQLVYAAVTAPLQTGKQVMTIRKELPATGIYILNIRGNDIQETIAFVKE